MSSSQYLPLELVMEILSWVGVKDLMRFRSVSKSWSSLVFDPDFIKLHLDGSSKNTDILLTFEDSKDISKAYAAACSIQGLLENISSSVDASQRLNLNHIVLGVCNGLVCLRDDYFGVEFQEYRVRFWNPATRIVSEDSPPLRLSLCNYKFGWYSLLFGFWYDNCCDTYKVVALLSDIKSQKMEVRVHDGQFVSTSNIGS